MIARNQSVSRRRSRGAPKPDNSPSPERIRELTEEIRQGWSPRELCRRSNAVEHVELYQLPLEPHRRGSFGD